MATGSYELYRKDAAGNSVPCTGVTYRIVSVEDGVVVASGKTNEHGKTEPVSGKPRPPWSLGTGAWLQDKPAYRPSPLLPEGSIRYQLQVRDSETGQWIEPWLHADTRNAMLELDAQEGTPVADGDLAEVVMVVKRLRLRSFHEFQFYMKASRKPIQSAPYVAYTHDSKGRQLVATDANGKPIKGRTDRHGRTGRIECEQNVWVVFNLPDSKAEFLSRQVEPVVSGMTVQRQTVGAKGQVAVSAPGNGRVANVSGKISAPAVLNAADEELLLLTPAAWREFDEVSGFIDNTMAGVHRARMNLDDALKGRSAEAIRQAEQDLNLAEDKVADLLNKDLSRKADLVEVVTFESYDAGSASGKEGLGRTRLRRRYVPRKKYEEYKRKRIGGIPYKLKMSVSARVKGGPVSAKHAGSGEQSERKKFDAAKFKESLEQVKIAGKKELVKTDPWVWDMLDMGGNEFSETVRKSDSYKVDTASQWMRCVAGAGASGEANWDPKKGKVTAQVSGSAQAKLVLFEGSWTHTLSIPSRSGWQMNYGGIDLGAIVFQLACELYGFVGAKASVVGAVGVTLSGEKTEAGDKAKIKPQARDRGDSLATNYDSKHGLPRADLGDPPPKGKQKSSRIVPAALNETPPSDINGMDIRAEAFAGAEAGLTPSGELQWLPPERPTPVSFARLSLDIAGSAGAGVNAQLAVYYAKGRFRIKASARLCWGLGAKGALDFVVDAGGMLEFAKWMYYQLAHAGFKELAYIAKAAFEAFSQVVFMLISEESAIGAFLKDSTRDISEALHEVMRSLEIAENRYKLVSKINSARAGDEGSAWLTHATPETRGMLLYALTRHSPASHTFDAPEVRKNGVEFLNEHKQAVLRVVKGVQVRSEWANMMQHMTIDGRKLTMAQANAQMREVGDRRPPLTEEDKVAGWSDGNVIRFLSYGIGLIDEDDLKSDVFDPINLDPSAALKGVDGYYLQQYLDHRARLLGVFPKGYEVATLMRMEETERMLLDGRESPRFAMIDPDYLWMDRDQARTMLAMEHGAQDGTEIDLA